MSWFWLLAGGLIGTAGRYALSGVVYGWAGSGFPFGTLAVNTLGCFLMGCAATLVDRSAMSPEARLFCMIGGLGAFTTFSSLIYESWRLMQDGQAMLAAANVAGSVVLGCFAFWLGSVLASAL